MINPTAADLGRSVVYTERGWRTRRTEIGVITSFNDHYVFVRYGEANTSQATERADLSFFHEDDG